MSILNDCLFAVGFACFLGGCWVGGIPSGLIGTGLAMCLVSVFIHNGRLHRLRKRRS